MPRAGRLAVPLAISQCLAGCGAGERDTPKQLTPGAGQIWLASTEPTPADPKYFETRPKLEVAGVVTRVEAGPAAPPAGLQKFFSGEGASQVLVVMGDDGLRWSLGYHLERGEPAVDVTPDLKSLVGTRVSLLFRAEGGIESQRSANIFGRSSWR